MADENSAVGKLMGTTAHVIVCGEGDPHHALDRLQRLERLWSRFIDSSEVSRVSRLRGDPVVVSPETLLLFERSVDAWRRTGGLFDATMLDHLEAAGYDRTFEDLQHVDDMEDGAAEDVDGGNGDLHSCSPASQVHPNDLIETHPDIGLVRLPAGVRIDPGGIGKGLAADLVALLTLGDGADGALISVGGDLRAAGAAPPDGWEVELDHHIVEPARINLRDGAIATSTRLGRRWRTPSGISHHVIDPRTHRPSTGPAVAVSVVAAEAWWAEAVATAVLVGVGTPGFDQLAGPLLENAGALVTTVDRVRHRLGPLGSAFLVPGDAGSDPAGPGHLEEIHS